MSSEQIGQSGSNQRTAFRCATDTTYQAVSLKSDRAEFPAQLLDESAGGFAVRLQGPLEIETNDLVWLHTNSGWFQVRVANVAEEAEPDTDRADEDNRDQQGGDQLPPTFRLGLQRLRDVEPWDDPTIHASWFSRLSLARLPLFENPRTLIGTGTLALFGLTMLIAGLFMWQAGYPVTELFNLNRSKSSSHGSVLPRLGKHISKSLRSAVKAMPGGWIPDPSTQPASSSNPTNPTNPDSPAKRASSSAQKSSLRGAINRLSGATVFTLPDMVKELSLTKAQQAEIRKITKASSDALRHIDRYWKTGNRHEQAQARAQMHGEARQHVLGTLTAEQRKKWEELKGGRE